MSDTGSSAGGPNASIRPHAGPNPYGAPQSLAGANVPPPPPKARRRRRGVPFVLVLVVVIAALGAGGYAIVQSREPATPGEAVTSFVRAASNRDIPKTCDLVAESGQQEFADKGITCEEDLARLFADADQAPSADGTASGLFAATPADPDPTVQILEERIHGDRAELVVRVGDRPEGPLVLVREDGRWKIDFSAEPSHDPAIQTCRTEERTVRTAGEAYEAQYDRPPASAQTLVDTGMLKALPRHAKVASDGTITMTGRCA